MLGIGLALFGILIYIGGLENLRQIGRIKPLPLAGFFLVTLGITGCVALRWGSINNALSGGQTAAWHDYYHYFVTSRALGFVLPKDVADVGSRALWLTQMHDVTLAQASASILLDRLFDLLTNTGMLLAVLPFWLGWTGAALSYSLMGVIPLLVLSTLYFSHETLSDSTGKAIDRLVAFGHRIPWVGKRIPASLDIGHLDRRTVLAAYGYSVLKFAFTVTRLAFLGIALSPPIAAEALVLGTPLAQFSYLLAFTPGGLGIYEAGWYAILQLGHAPEASIPIFLIGQRVLTALSIGVWALISHVVYVVRPKRNAYRPGALGEGACDAGESVPSTREADSGATRDTSHGTDKSG